MPPLQSWFSLGVFGIGGANFLSDLGQEIPTVLLPTVLKSLGAPAATLSLIEGAANAAHGLAKLVGGPVADAARVRRPLAIVSYIASSGFSACIGLGATSLQVGTLRVLSMASKGFQTPARSAILADLVHPTSYGRAFGLKRVFDGLGAIVGLTLMLSLISRIKVADALSLSALPGLLAAALVFFTVRKAAKPARAQAPPPVSIRLSGELRRMLVGLACVQVGVVAATLPILRATQVLATSLGHASATRAVIAAYITYKLAAAAIGVPAGYAIDRFGAKRVLVAGALLFALGNLAYVSATPAALSLGFVISGLALGCLETAQSAAIATVARPDIRGSAFGLLASAQNIGTVCASALAGAVWTWISPVAAFGLLAILMAAGAVGAVFLMPSQPKRS